GEQRDSQVQWKFHSRRPRRRSCDSMTCSSSCARSNPARPLLGLLLWSLSIRRSAAATRSRARSKSATVYCRGPGRVRFPRRPFDALRATRAALSCFAGAIWPLRRSSIFLLDRIDDHNRRVQPPPHAPAVCIWDRDSGKQPQPNVSGLSAYRLMLRRSSSIRSAGGRSCWCRSRYSAISSSTFGVGPANTLVKNRCHNETPRLTVGASIDQEEAGIALSRQHPFHTYTHIASFTRMM